jgi:hypothetical protein
MPRPEQGPRPGGEERDGRLTQAVQLLEDGIDGILSSDGFAAYLRTMAHLPQYSFGNLVLIHAQHPHPTMIAGYRKWQELGRQVRKGEKGLKIFVPHKYPVPQEEAETEERARFVLRGFGVGTVFDVSQTDGPPLPEPPQVQTIEGESTAGTQLYHDLLNSLEADGVTVAREETRPAHGYYEPLTDRIVLGHHVRGDQATKTLAHEIAHRVAGHTLGMNDRDVETVAESVAFVVLTHFGVDSSGYSFPYVARWARERDILKRNLETIQQVAQTMIGTIEERRERTEHVEDRDLQQDQRDEPERTDAGDGMVSPVDVFVAGFEEVQLSDERLSAIEGELAERGIHGRFRRQGDA